MNVCMYQSMHANNNVSMYIKMYECMYVWPIRPLGANMWINYKSSSVIQDHRACFMR